MYIEKKLNKFIYNWVAKNFGTSEANDPSWSIKALAHDLADEFFKIKEAEELENIKEDVLAVAEMNNIELTEKEAYDVADDYRYSEAYCARDNEAIEWFIRDYKDGRK